MKRDLESHLRDLIYHTPRVGDFSKGDPIRREPIVIDQYGGYAIQNSVSLSPKLTFISQVPHRLSSWAGMVVIRANTDHTDPPPIGPIGKLPEYG